MLGHELRNPLGGDHHRRARARPGASTADPRRSPATIIDRQARHLARLVDDLLDVARVITGQDRAVPPTAGPRRGGDAQPARAPRHRPPRPARRRSSRRRPCGSTPTPVRVEQIVDNLVSNALKYTPPGGRDPRRGPPGARRRGARRPGHRDRNPGRHAAAIFDLFAQGDQRLDRARGGLGIGLTLVKRLVELHGASVQAVSEGAGKGSRFVVNFRAIAPPRGRSLDAVAAGPAPRRDRAGCS